MKKLQEKCAQLEQNIQLSSAGSSEGASQITNSSAPPSTSSSSQVAALMQKWQEVGVDSNTRDQIMTDLKMSIDERASKYLLHLTAQHSEQKASIKLLETEVDEHMHVLGKSFSSANVYGSNVIPGPIISVVEKKKKLEEYLKNVKVQVEKEKSRLVRRKS